MLKRAYAIRRASDAHEPWTDAREDDVRRLWQEGRSAAEIAKALGGTTRNAVLGIVHRRGWSARGVSAETARKLSKPAMHVEASTAIKPRKQPAPLAPRPEPKWEGALNIDIMALTLTKCRFVTDTEKWAPKYCGVRVREGSSFCPHHHRLCWTPAGAVPSLPRAVRKGRDEGW